MSWGRAVVADYRRALPTVAVLLNGIAFWIIRPDVPDLWAARARAAAVGHGVGLTYWFSWFGGSTPANYSVITPYLSAKLGTELVAALAAVAVTAIVTALVRDTAHPLAAAWVAAFVVVMNLWCGRVAFLLGSAFACAALICVRRRAAAGAAALAIVATLASPIAGAFLCIGLSGTVLTPRVRHLRVPAVVAAGSAGATLIALGALFGVPGPEPLPLYLVGEIALALLVMLAAAPPEHLRKTLWVSVAALVAVSVVPNGMGGNFMRLALFCLPPAVVALSRRPRWSLAVLATPVLVLSALTSTSALESAARPASSAAYYAALAHELDSLRSTADYRLELVSASHAGYAALLDHAVLARGWETQQDLALNSQLVSKTLGTRSYRHWLDANAVGFVALNVPANGGPEARVVSRARYLRVVWRSAHWQLLRVAHPRPIVAPPARLTSSTEATLTVHVPCSCQVSLRIRWSRFLSVEPRLPAGVTDTDEDTYRATLLPHADGWTSLQSQRPGTYVLSGTL